MPMQIPLMPEGISAKNGNFGIGVNAPLASCHIAKISSVLSGSGNSYGAYIYPTSSGDVYIDALTGGSSNTSLHLRSYYNGTYNQATLDYLGNLKFNSGFGSVATAYGCRAWVNFNGTGTVAIRASGNVSSITDNGTGDYTINFANAMPDANYSINATIGMNFGTTAANAVYANSVIATGAEAAPTTSAVRIGTTQAGSAGLDNKYINIAIFR